jgi:small multidrug resistance family-3 protein
MLRTVNLYHIGSHIWGLLVDKKKPDRYEAMGSFTAILGGIIIFYAPR